MVRVLFLVALLLPVALCQPITDELNDEWDQWKVTFGKNFTAQEDTIRRIVWENNLKFVTRHNLEYSMGKHTYTVGMNEFAHLTSTEFATWYLSHRQTEVEDQHLNICNQFLAPSNTGRLPDSVDWRTKGYVTPVVNQVSVFGSIMTIVHNGRVFQQQMGCSSTFSATGSLEGQHFKKTGKLVALSEQNLLDCANDHHCAIMDVYFKYIIDNGGIDTKQCYPNTIGPGECRFNASCVGATMTGCTDVKSGDEMALQSAVATVGPVSVAVDASHVSFQLYQSGVYTESSCSSTQVDHAMLIVGYGAASAVDDYWIVKNSWGVTWGVEGYIYMARNKDNMCGIASYAVYPLV